MKYFTGCLERCNCNLHLVLCLMLVKLPYSEEIRVSLHFFSFFLAVYVLVGLVFCQYLKNKQTKGITVLSAACISAKSAKSSRMKSKTETQSALKSLLRYFFVMLNLVFYRAQNVLTNVCWECCDNGEFAYQKKCLIVWGFFYCVFHKPLSLKKEHVWRINSPS